jgi:protease-4
LSKKSGIGGVFAVLLLIFFLFLLFFVIGFVAIKNVKIEGLSGLQALENDSPIAVIDIKGPIMESREIIELLLEAESDNSIEAIILRIDSPGGAVGPTQEIYEEVVRIDQSKPIYSSFGAIAASGGYYIGAATRKIFANAGTLTGSIGVIMQFMNMSELYKWAKLDPKTIKAGKYKDVGSPFRDMTDEEQAYLKNMLAGTHRQFINDISRTRKEKIQGDLIEHAQGQIFSGEDALKKGLVDELGGLWACGRKVYEELGLKGKFQLRFLKPKTKFNWRDLLEDVETKAMSYFLESPTPMFIAK